MKKRGIVMKSGEMAELINVALGNEKADLVITNGTLLNVYTGELLDNYSVAVKGERIAYTGKDIQRTIGPETIVIDAAGKTIVPGFIDSHTHLCFCTVDEFLRYSIRGGTTTIVAEVLETAFALGFQGIIEFLESCKDQLAKVFSVVPSMASISPGIRARAINKEQLRELLKRDDVLGLGETYWLSVVDQDERLLELFEETLKAGKKITGHSAGAKGHRLAAYAACGVCSCHEPITAEEVVERLRLGMFVLAREGDVRKDLEAIAKIKDMNINLSQFVLASDGTSIKQVIEEGYMDVILRKAIRLGFDPISAIQMVTINPARYLNIDDRVGGIAPGKMADIVIIPNLQEIKAEYVISNGQVVAKNGELVVQPKKYSFPEWTRHSIHMTKTFTPDDFQINVPGNTIDSVEVRLMEQVSELVTQEARLNVHVSQGKIIVDTEQDLLKAVAIDFTATEGKHFVGLIKGFKMKKGAIASSAAWDLANIVAVGVNDEDLALAVNRIVQMQGGAVVCSDGKVLAEFSLPIGGILTDAPIEDLLQKTEEFQNEAAGLGSPFPHTHLTLVTLTTPAIPFFRICEEGYVDIRTNQLLGLIIS